MKTRATIIALTALLGAGIIAHAAMTYDVGVAFHGPDTYEDGSPLNDNEKLTYKLYSAGLGISNATWTLVAEVPGIKPTSCSALPTNAQYCIQLTDISIPDQARGFQIYATATHVGNELESGPSDIITKYFDSSVVPDPVFGDTPPGAIIINLQNAVFKIDGVEEP